MAKCTGMCLAFALLLVPVSAEGASLPLTVAYTGHEVSHFLPHSPAIGGLGVGGLGRLAGVIKELRQSSDGPVLVLSAGSPLGGTPFASLPPTAHRQLMWDAGYDLLAAADGQLYAFAGESCTETAVLIRLPNGLRIGVLNIGINSDGKLTGEVIEDLQHQLGALRQCGAQITLALSQGSLQANQRLAQQLRGLDVLIGSDGGMAQHHPTLAGQAFLVHCSPFLQAVGVLGLTYSKEDGILLKGSDGDPAFTSFALDANAPVLVSMQQKAQRALQKSAWWSQVQELRGDLFTPISRLDSPLLHTPGELSRFSNLLSDAILFAAEQVTSRPVRGALLAPDLIGGSLYPVHGQISSYDLLWPLASGEGKDGRPGVAVVSFYLTGEEIRQLLEASLWWQRTQQGAAVDLAGLHVLYDPGYTLWFDWAAWAVPRLNAVQQLQWSNGDLVSETGLYHLASDYSTLTSLLAISAKLPQLSIHPRDEQGVVVEGLDALVLHLSEGKELKVWHATFNYLLAGARDAQDLPIIPSAYEQLRMPYQLSQPRADTSASIWWLSIILVLGLAAIVVKLNRRFGQLG